MVGLIPIVRIVGMKGVRPVDGCRRGGIEFTVMDF